MPFPCHRLNRLADNLHTGFDTESMHPFSSAEIVLVIPRLVHCPRLVWLKERWSLLGNHNDGKGIKPQDILPVWRMSQGVSDIGGRPCWLPVLVNQQSQLPPRSPFKLLLTPTVILALGNEPQFRPCIFPPCLSR